MNIEARDDRVTALLEVIKGAITADRNATIDEIIAIIHRKIERNEPFTSGWDFIKELENLKR